MWEKLMNVPNQKDELIMNPLLSFFRDKGNKKKLLRIIGNDKKISLRVIDWFVTNYSRKHNTYYKLKDNNEERLFIVYLDYKSQLKWQPAKTKTGAHAVFRLASLPPQTLGNPL